MSYLPDILARQVIKDPKSAPHHCLPTGCLPKLIGSADARREVVVGSFEKRRSLRRQGELPGVIKPGAGNGQRIRADEIRSVIQVIPQTICQGQPRRRLPRILRVESEIFKAENSPPALLDLYPTHTVRNDVGKVVVEPNCHIASRGEDGRQAAIINAEPQTVVTFNNREMVNDVGLSLRIGCVQPGGKTCRPQTSKNLKTK